MDKDKETSAVVDNNTTAQQVSPAPVVQPQVQPQVQQSVAPVAPAAPAVQAQPQIAAGIAKLEG